MGKDQALRNWLRGMTCKSQTKMDCVWESPCGRFVVFRHFSHSTYVDRMTGVSCCEAHQDLIDLENLGVDCYGRFDHLKSWTGRWNKTKAAEAEVIVQKLGTPPWGENEGDPCNRDGCDGVMVFEEVEGCTCHVSPPCAICTSARLLCDTCGEESGGSLC